MVLMTTMLTGLFAGMLRSAFAVIIVAFLITVVFAMAAIFYGASIVGLGLAIVGFNLGLTAFAATRVLGTGAPQV